MSNKSSITQVKSIRIKNATADFFSDKPLNKVVESVHSLAEEKRITIERDGKIILPDHHD